MSAHYEESLQRSIELIRQKVLEMSGLCESALKLALRAIQERNRQLAYTIILRDQRVDALEKQIDRLCLEFLVRQQPVARPLRFVYATIKINAELERIGDYAESIARQILKLSSLNLPPASVRYEQIAGLAIPMLHDAVKAFVEQDAALARKTMLIEEEVDVLRSQINSDLIAQSSQGQIPVEALTPLMTVARRFERVSDQAKNICEEALYMVTGEYAKHEGSDVTRILFVDRANACRGQMAEGIGNALNQPQLVFASAGIEARPVDKRVVQFLAGKGVDIARQSSKSIPQVPNLENYQVIVLLSKEAQRSLPDNTGKAIVLDWNVKDPSLVEGSEAEVSAAYEETYQFIRAHLLDFSEAILGDKI